MTAAATVPAQPRGRTAGKALALAALVALGLVAVMVTAATSATWTDSTRSDGNAWASATVSLTDDAPDGLALFTAEDMLPGSVVENAITVTNDSSVALDVRLYGENLANGDSGDPLAAHLNLRIGTSPGAGDVFDATVADFAATHSGYATGTPVVDLAAGAARTYHFRVELDQDTPQSVSGDSAGIDFVWEGQTR